MPHTSTSHIDLTYRPHKSTVRQTSTVPPSPPLFCLHTFLNCFPSMLTAAPSTHHHILLSYRTILHCNLCVGSALLFFTFSFSLCPSRSIRLVQQERKAVAMSPLQQQLCFPRCPKVSYVYSFRNFSIGPLAFHNSHPYCPEIPNSSPLFTISAVYTHTVYTPYALHYTPCLHGSLDALYFLSQSNPVLFSQSLPLHLQYHCPYDSAQTSTYSRQRFNYAPWKFFLLAACVLACPCYILSESFCLPVPRNVPYRKYRFQQTDPTLLYPCSSRLFNSLVVTSMQFTSIFDLIHVLSALPSLRKEHICKDTWQLVIAHQHHPPHKFRDHGFIL